MILFVLKICPSLDTIPVLICFVPLTFEFLLDARCYSRRDHWGFSDDRRLYIYNLEKGSSSTYTVSRVVMSLVEELRCPENRKDQHQLRLRESRSHGSSVGFSHIIGKLEKDLPMLLQNTLPYPVTTCREIFAAYLNFENEL